MKRLRLALVTLCCVGLTACEEPENEVNWEISAECTRDNGCKVGGKISGSFGGGGDGGPLMAHMASSSLLTDALMTASAVPDAAQFSITVGGDIYYPSTGQVLISLIDSSDGTIQAVDVFPWVKSGNLITLANPNAVNNWAISEGGTADTLDYELVAWDPQVDPGEVSVSAVVRYEGVPKTADFQTYCVDTSGEYRQEATLCQ